MTSNTSSTSAHTVLPTRSNPIDIKNKTANQNAANSGATSGTSAGNPSSASTGAATGTAIMNETGIFGMSPLSKTLINYAMQADMKRSNDHGKTSPTGPVGSFVPERRRSITIEAKTAANIANSLMHPNSTGTTASTPTASLGHHANSNGSNANTGNNRESVSSLDPYAQAKLAAQAAKPKTKEERRALQEAQRAAKAAGISVSTGTGNAAGQNNKTGSAFSAAATPVGPSHSTAANATTAAGNRTVTDSHPQSSQLASASSRSASTTGGSSSAAQSNSSSSSAITTTANSSANTAASSVVIPSIPFNPASTATCSLAMASFGQTAAKQVSLFSHLPLYEHESVAMATGMNLRNLKDDIHPAIIRLGLLYSQHLIIGSNERCIALLEAFRQVIASYKVPPNAVLSRHLDGYLRPMINYLVQFRPLSTSMGNAIRFLKCRISEIGPDADEASSKEHLMATIDTYIQNRIRLADELIGQLGMVKIHQGDLVLTFAHSTAVLSLLVRAAQQGRHFRVIVIDNRPFHEGRKTLQELTNHGIPCSYALIDSLGYLMPRVNKVFLGAACIFSNGNMMARVGSALVAMMAAELDVPVAVVCETYKFSDRVQLDSFVYNEVSDPADLLLPGPASSLAASSLADRCIRSSCNGGSSSNGSSIYSPIGNRAILNSSTAFHQHGGSGQVVGSGSMDVVVGGGHSSSSGNASMASSGSVQCNGLKLLNVMYDVTPAKNITVIITEIGMIPCSSVPVVLREYRPYAVI